MLLPTPSKWKRRLTRWLGIDRHDLAIGHLLARDLNLLSALPEGGTGNHALREAFLSLISLLRPTIFCDIGANDGSTALAIRQLAPSCAVYGFEANPHIHALHADAMRDAGIEWLNLAISDRDGQVSIFSPRTLSRAYAGGKLVSAQVEEPADTGKTSLLLRNENATYERFEVKARSLDSMFASGRRHEAKRRFFLWIDVEGAADKVLSGAKAVLKETEAILIETENYEFWRDQKRAGDILDWLWRKGFVPLARDREYGDLQFNVLLVRGRSLRLLSSSLFDASTALRTCLLRPHVPAATSPANLPPSSANRYASVRGWLQASIPIFVPCYNNPTYVRSMLAQLRGLGFLKVVLVDNASTSPDMRIWLESIRSQAEIVCLPENLGPRDIFLDRRNLAMLPRHFCVTDPDLQINIDIPEGFLGDLATLAEKYQVGKAGFALDISDIEAMREEYFRIGDRDYQIWEWERQFWEKELPSLESGDPVYDAAIDTTFALYDKERFDPAHYQRAVRVAGRFTARHLPWYRDLGINQVEADLYRKTSKHSFYLRDPLNPVPQ